MQLSHLEAIDNGPLKDRIVSEVNDRGSMPFARFMQLALYDSACGYYITQDPTLDYQSSPNVHPVFGATIGRQLAGFWHLLGRPGRFDVFEAGAGNGRLATNVLDYLRAHEPELNRAIHYVVQDLIYSDAGRLPALPRGVELATDLPQSLEIEGCILSNELLDALPFDRVCKRSGRLLELHVGYADGRFVDVEVPARPEIEAYFATLGLEPGEDCLAEVCLEAQDWIAKAAKALRRGYILTLDYGYEAADLYASWRKTGTLLTFHRHTSGEDPFVRVGQQDITSSVDFTTVTRSGEAAGMTTMALVSQTDFLASLGIGIAVSQGPAGGDLQDYYALRRAVIELTDPSGLGRIRVLLQAKDVLNTVPAGFTAGRSA